MAIEPQEVVAFVFDALVADAAFSATVGGRIFRDQVPQAATLPAATVGLVSSVDRGTLGGIRVFDTVLVDVRVVAAGASYGPINAAGKQADVVLQNRTGSHGGVWVDELRRDQSQAFIENEAGTQFTHLIQTYRTEAFAL